MGVLAAGTWFNYVRWIAIESRYSGHPSFWRSRYRFDYHNVQIDEIIDDAARANNITLTWAARQMLAIPVFESLERGEDVGLRQVAESIMDVVSTMAEEPSPPDANGRRRTSQSVIRGFYRRFCNIPPFCSRREEAGR